MDGIKPRSWAVLPLLFLLACSGDDPPRGDGGGGGDLFVIPDQPASSCTPTNCGTGCCLNNTCLYGTADNACGYGGSPCTACQSNEKCSLSTHACVSSQKPDSGTGTTEAGTTKTSYAVMLGSAQKALGTFKCDSCPLVCDGICELYVKVKWKGAEIVKPKPENAKTSDNPTWDLPLFVATETELLGGSMEATLMDESPVDAILAFCTTDTTTNTKSKKVSFTQQDLSAGKLVTSCWYEGWPISWEVRFKVTFTLKKI